MSDPPVPDYLRSWFPTQEDYDATSDYVIDARVAWLHFEPLWTSLGYTICYGDDNDVQPRRALVDQNAAVDPFHPTPTSPLAHSLPDRIDMFMKRRPDKWKTSSPRVTLAYDKLDRLVIIKAVQSSEPSEMEIIKYLSSPELRASPKNHTIPLLGQAEAEGWHFLIMPAWNMSCFPPHLVWQVDDYFEMVIQTFEGLAFMHENGVAHRDISRRNIVFNQDGTMPTLQSDVMPYLSTWNARLAFIDFGLSRKFSLDTDAKTWVCSESWGTPTHMSPEVASAEEKSCVYQALPADVYALAKVWKRWITFEEDKIRGVLLNKTRTFEVATYACQVVQKHVPEYMELITEMLDDDPAKRPTAADALSRFKATRISIPENIRFAPTGGYPESLA